MKISPKNGAPSFSVQNRLRRFLFRIIWITLCTALPPSYQTLRHFILRVFGCRVGKGARIYGSAKIWDPAQLQIGMFSTIGPRVNIYNPGLVKIGNGVIISQDATVCSASHDYEVDEFHLLKYEIIISDKAWICAEAFIGPNSLIGIGAVVAARCVSMGTVAEWTVVAGNPARVIKKRPFTNYIHDGLNHDS